jgi:hypothetical protein
MIILHPCLSYLQMFSDDGSGNLGFENFLDMMSVFSPNCDDDVKIAYIFRLFGSYCHKAVAPLKVASLKSKYDSF